MRRSLWPGVARQLQSEVPDADLLERYVQGRDDDAFAQLLTRYSRLVWGQCRNLLTNDADADDAFQAVFLTLARSARTIRSGAPLGPWLHGVAFRVSKNARRANGRRTKREQATALPETNRPVADTTWEVAFAAVADEVQKLPEAQREAFILCCIEGRATTEAAASLGQKLGTFSARLTRAKQTLLNRLAKRGIGAGVLALGGITGTSTFAPAALIARTLALIPSGVVVPSSIVTLTHGVTGMMMIRLKLLAAGVLVATGFGLSVGGGWSSSVEAQGPGAAGGAPPAGGVPPGSGGFGPAGSDAGPGGPAAAKAPPKADELKADLEKARAAYEKSKRDYDALMDKKRKEESAEQYAYDDVPKEGLRTEVFQAKLTERRKSGWSFLGQVSLNVGEPSSKQYLAFHKPGRGPAGAGFPGSGGLPGGTGTGPAMGPPGAFPSGPGAGPAMGSPYGSSGPVPGMPGMGGSGFSGSGFTGGSGLPTEVTPSGAGSEGAPPVSYSGPNLEVPFPTDPSGESLLLRPTQPRPDIPDLNFLMYKNGPELPPTLVRIPSAIPLLPPLPAKSDDHDQLIPPTNLLPSPSAREKKLSPKTEAEYQAKIAALKKQVQKLLTDTTKVAGNSRVFNVVDYGTWDREQLVDVLRKVMAGETIQFELVADYIRVTGTPENFKAVDEWLIKLKK